MGRYLHGAFLVVTWTGITWTGRNLDGVSPGRGVTWTGRYPDGALPGRVAGGADADRLEDAARSQLLDGALRLERERLLLIVGFDAANVMRSRCKQCVHE